MKKTCLILAISLFCTQFLLAQQSKKALFLGNSYTYVNDLPSLLAEMALSLGDTLQHDGNLLGGYTLEGHSSNATSLSKIAEGTWDYVVLQEQSRRPAFPPAQVQVQVYPYAAILTDSIRAANECAEPLFFMTWGRENGDQDNCPFYNPLCTYEGMQQRLKESYLEMGRPLFVHSESCGRGVASDACQSSRFGIIRRRRQSPRHSGFLLGGMCVLLHHISAKAAEGAYSPNSLSANDAAIIQSVATETVLSSPDEWNIGANSVSAAFDYSLENGHLQCDNTSANAENHHWIFGDGAESLDPNPSHTYTRGGTYDITYIASDACSADTIWQTVETSLYCDSVFVDSCWLGPDVNTQIQLWVRNHSPFLFDYPGFILFNNAGDTIAKETVNYFGIGTFPQTHIMETINSPTLPFSGYVELHANFYDSLYCTFPVSIADTLSSSLSEMMPIQVHLSPNPATDIVNLDFGMPFSGNAKVFDILGKQVYTKLKNQTSPLNIYTNWPKGSYFIELT